MVRSSDFVMIISPPSRPTDSPLSSPGLTTLRYIDVVLVLIAAPVLLLIGVPGVGYGVGASAWIVLRAAGRAVERSATAAGGVSRLVALRLGYRLTRVFLLAAAVILARNGAGKADGLTALLVITFTYTLQLGLAMLDRPGDEPFPPCTSAPPSLTNR